MTCFPRNDYEPDLMFFGSAKAAMTDADTLKFPISDFIAEVLSPSTEAAHSKTFRDWNHKK